MRLSAAIDDDDGGGKDGDGDGDGGDDDDGDDDGDGDGDGDDNKMSWRFSIAARAMLNRKIICSIYIFLVRSDHERFLFVCTWQLICHVS